MDIGIGAIVKNEADSILEWIAFHRVIGIRRFFILDNDSDDGTSELLSALHRENIITRFHWPTRHGVRPQLPGYAFLLRVCTKQCGAIAFIDADEFIVPLNEEKSFGSFVSERFADDDVSAVALNWASFGSSGHLFRGDGLVIERFTRRAPESFFVNHHYKCIVRPERVVKFENPHHPRLKSGRIVDASGQDLALHPDHAGGLSAKVIWSGARVNHYAVKSFEEFITQKSQKGSASRCDRVKHRAYFEQHDRNEEACLLASSLAPRVRNETLKLEELIAPTLGKLMARKARVQAWCGWLEKMKRKCQRLLP